MTPKMEARLLQALAIKPTDDILEVGTGCAYLTALLAKSGKHVVSVDIYADFSEPAKQKLERYNISNVTLECGNALHGWQPSNLYDVIAVTGSVDTLDTAIKWQLRINGRLFVIVGKPPVMEAKLITRSAENNWHDETLFETCLPPLEGITGTKPFKF